MIGFEKVSRQIRGNTLVEAVDAWAKPGRMTALIGPNGAGKSTLISLAAGLAEPSQGTLYFDKRPLREWPAPLLAQRRARLAQQTTVAFPFSTLEVVLFGRHPHHRGRETRYDRKIAVAAMERAGVGHLAGRSFDTLSGGEQQRVHFARCLAQLDGEQTGRCLLLDEPVASLDLAHQHRLLEAVAGFCRQGLTAIVVIHDLTLAARYADELWVMDHGRLVAEGDPPTVLTAELLKRVFQVEAEPRFLEERICHLHVRTARAEGAVPVVIGR